MPITARIKFPLPAEDEDPFYDSFVGMTDAIDSSLYASREDRQLVLMDGGVFSFVVDTGTNLGTLTWDSTINIAAPITGFKWFIGANNVVLQDGEVFYVNLTRAPLSNVALTAKKGSQVPSTDADLVLGIRRGNRFYFRNGRSLENGETLNILEVTVGGQGARYYKTPCRAATAANVTLTGGAPAVVGGVTLAEGDRVLVWVQTLGSQNGIYSVQTLGSGSDGTWVRASDADTNIQVKAGMAVVVTEGTQADKLFELVTDNPIILGVTSLLFASAPTIGIAGEAMHANIPIALGQNTALGTPVVVGNYSFAKSQYTLTGTTVSTKFKVTAFTTGSATGQVLLFDLTAAAVVSGSTLSFTTALPIEQLAAVTLNAALHTYEVRIQVTAGVGSIFCQWAGIEVLNSF